VTNTGQSRAEAAITTGRLDRDEMVVQLLEGARKKEGIYRTELAARLGITPRTLRNRMARASSLKPPEVEGFVEALKLSAENRTNLYVLTGQQPPAPPISELRETREMALYQDMIDEMKHPVVVYGDAWDVITMNRAFVEVFGGVRRHLTAHPTRNTQRFIFFHPDAPTLLGAGDVRAFREHWLMPALAHFTATLQQRPQDPRLVAIERDILSRPALSRAYRRAPDWIAENGDIAINTSARILWDPRTGRVMNAHIITGAHQGYQAMTLQLAIFILRERQTSVAAKALEQGVLFGLGDIDGTSHNR
jgi:hypothetical protein